MIATPTIMKEIYDKYNETVFDSRLPQISFIAKKLPSRWGLAHFEYKKKDGDMTIVPTHITVTTYKDFSMEALESVMLHEMIHIEDYTCYKEHFIVNGVVQRYNAHGEWFKSRAREVSSLTNTLVEDRVSDKYLNTADTRTNNERSVSTFLLVETHDRYFYMKTKKSNIKYWVKTFKKDGTLVNNNYKVYETTYKDWLRVRNCNRSAIVYYIDKDSVEETIKKYSFKEVK